MRPLFPPSREYIRVEPILYALSDPVRSAIFLQIAAATSPKTCSQFSQVSERAIPQSTLSQHLKVLREAGLLHRERQGGEMRNTSRCGEIETRFPGLIPAIIEAQRVQGRA